MDPYYLALTTVTLASIYGLLALGISIIWSSLDMINMKDCLTAASGFPSWAHDRRQAALGAVLRTFESFAAPTLAPNAPMRSW